MFFLCFSGQDRLTIVQSILHHLQKYGMDIWYDNHKYILGDNKTKNYIRGIHESSYAIVIFSSTFPSSQGAIEELEVIKQRHDNGFIHVFPIFFNFSAKDVPPQFDWLCELIYNELDESTGTLLTCNQMVCKFFSDLLEQERCTAIEDILEYKKQLPIYFQNLLENYFEIVPANINSRLTLLYSLFLFLETTLYLPTYLIKAVHYLFLNTKLNLEYNFKEIILMEQAVCLAINFYITNSQ